MPVAAVVAGAVPVVSALVGIGSAIPLMGGTKPPFVRDLNNTPVILDQGDCPQLFFEVKGESVNRMAFNDTDGSSKGRTDVTIWGYFVDTAVNLDQIWTSRPRVVNFIDNFCAAVQADDTLGGTVEYCNCRSMGTRDDLQFNGSPFRGTIFVVTGFQYTG